MRKQASYTTNKFSPDFTAVTQSLSQRNIDLLTINNLITFFAIVINFYATFVFYKLQFK